MKRPLKLVGVLLLAAGFLFFAFRFETQKTGRRLQAMADRAQAGVLSWKRQGRDPSAVLLVMGQVKPEIDAGNPRMAEALLARALTMLSSEPRGDPQSPLPVYAGPELESDLYVNPARVSIDGYTGSAMEPFLSPDGHTLFFNNENDAGVKTGLRFAARTGKLAFRYLGELPGVTSKALDAVPSLDTHGHFYFTTLRDYEKTRNSLYTGEFDGPRVRNVRPVPGNISPSELGTINMDACISPDGQALFLSRAVIYPGAPAPKKSELMMARLKNGRFVIDPDGDRILRKVNAHGLVYAAAISADGLEIYFTRASQPRVGSDVSGARVRIMVSTRNSSREPFGEPRTLAALTGFVEAPSLSLDGKEMFFHKKVGGKFEIYRAVRNANR